MRDVKEYNNSEIVVEVEDENTHNDLRVKTDPTGSHSKELKNGDENLGNDDLFDLMQSHIATSRVYKRGKTK